MLCARTERAPCRGARQQGRVPAAAGGLAWTGQAGRVCTAAQVKAASPATAAHPVRRCSTPCRLRCPVLGACARTHVHACGRMYYVLMHTCRNPIHRKWPTGLLYCTQAKQPSTGGRAGVLVRTHPPTVPPTAPPTCAIWNLLILTYALLYWLATGPMICTDGRAGAPGRVRVRVWTCADATGCMHACMHADVDACGCAACMHAAAAQGLGRVRHHHMQ